MSETRNHVFKIEIERTPEEELPSKTINMEIKIADDVHWRISGVPDHLRIYRNGLNILNQSPEVESVFNAAIQEIYAEMRGLVAKAIAIIEDETDVKMK